MNSKILGISLALVVFGLLLLGSIYGIHESFATEPCSLSDVRYTWNSYDDIYTGKVVSISNQTEYDKDDPNLLQWQKMADVRINFELEHLLKGNPPLSWHKNVPLKSNWEFLSTGADHYTIGSEIFYIESYNGNGYGFQGACGIGVIKVGGSDLGGMVKDFFDHYEEIYGVPVEKSTHIHGEKTKCKNSEHILVLRDNGKRACVSEKTSQKMNWKVIENIGIQFQNTTNTEIKYDYQISGKISLESPYKQNGQHLANIIDDYEIALKLPTMIETGEINASVTIIDDYPLEMFMGYPKIHFVISSNLDFVGIPSDEIDISHPNKKHFAYPIDPNDFQPNYTETLFATIKALRTGTADISIYLGEHHKNHYYNDSDYYSDKNTFVKNYKMVIGEDETLLMDDYFKKHLLG